MFIIWPNILKTAENTNFGRICGIFWFWFLGFGQNEKRSFVYTLLTKPSYPWVIYPELAVLPRPGGHSVCQHLSSFLAAAILAATSRSTLPSRKMSRTLPVDRPFLRHGAPELSLGKSEQLFTHFASFRPRVDAGERT